MPEKGFEPTPVVTLPDQGEETSGGKSYYIPPEKLLQNFWIALTNARAEQGIVALMSRLGFNEARIDEGLAMHQSVTALFSAQKKEFGEQLGASGSVAVAFERANNAYGISVGVGRRVFKNDPNARTALMLDGPRSKLVSQWVQQAGTFYRNILANPEFIKKMARFGYTKEVLEEEQGLVQDVIVAAAQHKKEMGESQEATQKRDKAFAELEEWMADFYMVAKKMLKDSPQWMEKLGIVQK